MEDRTGRLSAAKAYKGNIIDSGRAVLSHRCKLTTLEPLKVRMLIGNT
jgi:hypothetical protein